MGSPVLNDRVFAVETANETFPQPQTGPDLGRGADSALTGRAVVAVSGLGVGFWYVLWKIALHFVAGR
jgi:hypothetical protein